MPFAPTIASNGTFSFPFANPENLANGNFKVDAVASYAKYPSVGTTKSDVYIQIADTTPAAVTDFRLNPADDTGIVGDDITSARMPYFIGTAPAGDTVELLESGSSTVYDREIAQSTTNDLNGQPYDFSVQLPNILNDGQITLQVIVIDKISGNASGLSNPTTVTIVSVASDYNVDSYSDAALYGPNATNAGQWLVQTTSEVKPITFTGTLAMGSASITTVSSLTGLFIGQTITGTGIPSGVTIKAIDTLNSSLTLSTTALLAGTQSFTATPPPFWFSSGTTFPTNAQFPAAVGLPAADGVPFQGDFDGDGKADLAFYDLATATWYMDDSNAGLVSFNLGTANASVPVVGYFDFNSNLPEEAAVYTVVNGTGTWSINAGNAGVRTVLFGRAGDIPVPGDYTGVGYDELAVYRPSTGQFLVQVPGASGPTTLIIPLPAGTPDLSSLVPVPGNYDPYLKPIATFTGTLTMGSASVTGLSSTTGLVVGQTVTGTVTGILLPGTKIQSIDSSTDTITLSSDAIANGSQSLTASEWIENTEAAWYDPNTGVYTIQGPNGSYTSRPGSRRTTSRSPPTTPVTGRPSRPSSVPAPDNSSHWGGR